MREVVLHQLKLTLRWGLWAVPSAVLAAPLSALLALLLATDLATVASGFTQLLSTEHLVALAFGSMGLTPFYAAGVLCWAALAMRFPQIDRSSAALVVGFPLLVAALLTLAGLVIYAADFTWLAVPVPLAIGTLPLAARFLDPRLPIGAFAGHASSTVAG